MQNKWSTIVGTVLITAVVAGGGVYLWQNAEQKSEVVEPISYTVTGVPAKVSIETTGFDYDAETLQGLAEECGATHEEGYFESLVETFRDTSKTMYHFTYQGDTQDTGKYTATLLPNVMNYTTMDQFKKDFDLCLAGGEAYPYALNSKWLLFVSGCGGFDDGSGLPLGCHELSKNIEPTLKLN